MSKSDKRDCIVAGFVVAVLSFVLLFVGIKFILRNEIITKNIIAFAGFSILAGIIISLLMLYKFKIIYTSFIIGLVVGFALMYRTFLQEASDWRDLIGLLSLFVFTLLSLGIGMSVQLGYHLFKKYKL